MTRAEYNALDAINWSRLKNIGRSPLHYQWALSEPPPETTDAMDVGTVAHYAVFQPWKLETHVAVWIGPRRAGKAWEEFEAIHNGKLLIRKQDYDRAIAIAKSARAAAGKLLSEGESEVVLQWTHPNGMKAKGMLDHISRGFGIVDLKSCADASPIRFGAHAAGLQYHGQAAYYTDGAELCEFGRLPYNLLAVESKPPYAAAIYTVSERDLELGRALYEEHLDILAKCLATNDWPGYAPGLLQLPRWATWEAEDEDTSNLIFED